MGASCVSLLYILLPPKQRNKLDRSIMNDDKWKYCNPASYTKLYAANICDASTVDSNDVLYGREPQFVADVDSICTVVLDNILERLYSLVDKPNSQVSYKKELILKWLMALRIFFTDEIGVWITPACCCQSGLKRNPNGYIGSQSLEVVKKKQNSHGPQDRSKWID